MGIYNFVCDYKGEKFDIIDVDSDAYSLIQLYIDIWREGPKQNVLEPKNPIVSYRDPGLGENCFLMSDELLMGMFMVFEEGDINLLLENADYPDKNHNDAREVMGYLDGVDRQGHGEGDGDGYGDGCGDGDNAEHSTENDDDDCFEYYGNFDDNVKNDDNLESFEPVQIIHPSDNETSDSEHAHHESGDEVSSIDDEWQLDNEAEVFLSETSVDTESEDCSGQPDGACTSSSEEEDGEQTAAGWDNVHVPMVNSDEEADDIPIYFKNGKWFSYLPNGKIKLLVGHMFKDKREFHNVVREYAIQKGFALDKKRNTSKKFWAYCKKRHNVGEEEASDGSDNEKVKGKKKGSGKGDKVPKSKQIEECPFYIYASVLADNMTFQIKTFKSEHKCIRILENPSAWNPWIVDAMLDEFRANPDMTIKVMRQRIRQRFGVKVKRRALYRGRIKLSVLVEGSHEKSYERLPSYTAIIMQKSPGSITAISYKKPKVPNTNPLFKKIFIFFEAQKNGFLNGCRPFIGVDGCHLKGPYGGILLVACALDGNNGIFPIAIGVVEKESYEEWRWFFSHLMKIADQDTRKKWVIISDRQKGGIKAMEELMVEVRRRICARHFYMNLKVLFPGELLKVLFWKASKAQNEYVFLKAMEEIKKVSLGAYDYLRKEPMKHWVLYKFDSSIKVGEVTNNFTECFNGKVRKLRRQPMLTLLENIRKRCMKKMYKKKTAALRWKHRICPKIKRLVDTHWNEGFNIKANAAGNGMYECYEGVVKNFNVDLRGGTCDCGYWQNMGIPCKHVCAAVKSLRGDIYDYVSEWFTKDKYLKTYDGVIHPIPQPCMWPNDNLPILDPPEVCKKASRPKKHGRRDGPGEEPKSKRVKTTKRTEKSKGNPEEDTIKCHTQMTCSTCKQKGHNKRTCKGQPLNGATVAATTLLLLQRGGKVLLLVQGGL